MHCDVCYWYTKSVLRHKFLILGTYIVGYALAQLVDALRYKPEGRGFDSRWRLWNLFIDTTIPAALWPSG